MARQRRGGGGFRPPELRGTLGTLLRTTLAQAGVVREVLERGARASRSQISDALSGRRRTDALADLGEAMLDLIRRGEIDLEEIPEVRDIVAQLDELDAGHPEEHDAPPTAAPARSRFDSRRRDEADGTVSSSRWLPTKKPAARSGVWRPPVDSAPSGVNAERPADEITAREAPTPRKAAARKGGISFDGEDDDADLADYMHPDDVPKK